MEAVDQPNQNEEKLSVGQKRHKTHWLDYAKRMSYDPENFKMYNTKWLEHLHKNSKWSIWTFGLFCYGLVPVSTALWNARSFDYNIENCYYVKSNTGIQEIQPEHFLPMSQCIEINHGTNMSIRGLIGSSEDYVTCHATYMIILYQIGSLILVLLSLYYVYFFHKKAQVFALLLGLHAKPAKYKGCREYFEFSLFVIIGLLLCVVRVYFEENQCTTRDLSTYNIDGDQLSGYIFFIIKQTGNNRAVVQRATDFIGYFAMYTAILKILYNYFSNPWNTFSSIDKMIAKARKLQVDPAYARFEISLQGLHVMHGYFLRYPCSDWRIILCASFEQCYKHGFVKVIEEEQP